MKNFETNKTQNKQQVHKKIIRKGNIGVGCNNQTIIFQISLDSVYCNIDKEDELRANLADAATKFKAVTVAICDESYSLTLQIRNPQQSEQQCKEIADQKGTELFNLFNEIAQEINRQHVTPKIIVRREAYWTSGKNETLYNKEYIFLKELYDQKSEQPNKYAITVNQVAVEFISKQKLENSLLEGKNIAIIYRSACLYQLKQAALYLCWSAEGLDYLEYPGPTVETLKYLKKNYVGIDKQRYPGRLEHTVAKITDKINTNIFSLYKQKKKGETIQLPPPLNNINQQSELSVKKQEQKLKNTQKKKKTNSLDLNCCTLKSKESGLQQKSIETDKEQKPRQWIEFFPSNSKSNAPVINASDNVEEEENQELQQIQKMKLEIAIRRIMLSQQILDDPRLKDKDKLIYLQLLAGSTISSNPHQNKIKPSILSPY